MVMRVGRHCQAIFRRHAGGAEAAGQVDPVLVERWHQAEESGAWVKDGRSHTAGEPGSDVLMPSQWVCEQARKMGDVIELSGRKWRVVECSSKMHDGE
jgi:hypothetical protein